MNAAPGEVKTEAFDLDLKTRSGHTVPVRLFHKVAFGADGSPGVSRTLVLNRAKDVGIDPQRAAEVRFMRFFNNTPMAIATVDKTGSISRSNGLFARLFQGLMNDRRRRRALDPLGRRRTRPRGARSRDPQGRGRAGRHRAGRGGARGRAPSALRRSMSPRRKTRRARRKPPSSTRSRPPTSACWKTRSSSRRKWNPSASSPAASRTTSTMCSPPS